jgi:hypothetical protein
VADQQEVLKSLSSCKVVFYFKEMLFKLYLLYPTNYMVQTMMNWILKKKKKTLFYHKIWVEEFIIKYFNKKRYFNKYK